MSPKSPFTNPVSAASVSFAPRLRKNKWFCRSAGHTASSAESASGAGSVSCQSLRG